MAYKRLVRHAARNRRCQRTDDPPSRFSVSNPRAHNSTIAGACANVVTGDLIGSSRLVVYQFATKLPYDTVRLAFTGLLQKGLSAEVFEFLSDDPAL